MPSDAPDPAAEWITAREIEETYGIPAANLEYWCKSGCEALGGRRPRFRRAPYGGFARGESGRGAYLYRRADIESIAATPLCPQSFKDSEGEWVTEREARDRYARALRLGRWRKAPCPALGDRPIRSRRVLTAGGGGGPRSVARRRVWFYLAADVAQLAAPGTSPRHGRAPEIPGWITAQEARARFGFGKQGLLHWRVRRCIHLGGRKLAARKIKTTLRGQVRVLWRYSVEDLEAIAEKAGAPSPLALQDAAGRWEPAAQILRSHGIRASILTYWRLIGRVRARQVPVPPGHFSAHKTLWIYHLDDVIKARALPDGRIPGGKATPALAGSHKTNAGQPGRPTQQTAVPRRRPGRPKGSIDPEVARRKGEMLEAWGRGEFDGNKAAAGRAYGFNRTDATNIINDHERDKCQK
jgi:hypothetical protein